MYMSEKCNTSDLMIVDSLTLLTLLSPLWTVMHSKCSSTFLWFGGLLVAIFEAQIDRWLKYHSFGSSCLMSDSFCTLVLTNYYTVTSEPQLYKCDVLDKIRTV